MYRGAAIKVVKPVYFQLSNKMVNLRKNLFELFGRLVLILSISKAIVDK